MDEVQLSALVSAAAKAAAGMGQVAGDKPDQTPLHSDAHTFRGIATMLNSLGAQAREAEEGRRQLSRAMRRIANLEVRDGTALVERGDWKAMVAELQAIAQDALAGGARPGGGRRA